MIKTVVSPVKMDMDHDNHVRFYVKELEQQGHFITEVRRIQRSWWGLWADEDITQITYRKKD